MLASRPSLTAVLIIAAAAALAPPDAPAVAAAKAALTRLDAALMGFRPSGIALLGAGVATAFFAGVNLTAAVRAAGGWGRLALSAAAALPGPVGTAVRKELASVAQQVSGAVPRRPSALGPPLTRLPPAGSPAPSVLKTLEASAAGDGVRLAATPTSRASGTLYLPGGGEHAKLTTDAYAAFIHSNPMHASAFPAAVALERDVVAMAGSLVGASDLPDIGGIVTSGGSESILTAVLAARNLAARSLAGLARRAAGRPFDLVLASSAHPAFRKAASLFGLRVIVVPVRADGRLHAADLEGALTPGTVLAVASAVSFPHGALDDVAGCAAVCASRGVPLHVDACLGGFVLPFSTAALPPWGFDAGPAVSSISIDPHKAGLSHKGVSVVLLRGSGRRRAAYSTIVDWPGGLYASPGLPGSRSGALVATAWAALVHQGAAGFRGHAASTFAAVATVRTGIESGPLSSDLAVIGDPVGPVVAFRARDPASLDVWAVGDALAARGWRLSALAHPPALHMCFTPASVGSAADLVRDLAAAVAAVKAAAEVSGDEAKPADSGAMAPLYGQASSAAGTSLGRAGVSAFLELYQDALVMGGGGGQ